MNSVALIGRCLTVDVGLTPDNAPHRTALHLSLVDAEIADERPLPAMIDVDGSPQQHWPVGVGQFLHGRFVSRPVSPDIRAPADHLVRS
jgi:hypothetical protein